MHHTISAPPAPEAQLAEMGVHHSCCTLLRSKKGISLYRVQTPERSLVLKTFTQEADAREIANYHLLAALGVPSLPLLGHTQHALLLPDMDESKEFRLAVQQDLEDPQVIRAIAQWYQILHTRGQDELVRNVSALYDETDVITPSNMQLVAQKTHTEDQPLWHVLDKHFVSIRRRIDALPRTLTYNDFWWDNLIVARDHQSAFMFDYNLLGKGTIYGDLRNVTSVLSKKSADVFLQEYAPQELEEEARADAFLAPLVTLYFACEHECFPQWAEDSLQQVKSGDVLRWLSAWL